MINSKLNESTVLYYMQKAYDQAVISKRMHEVPVGCVLVQAGTIQQHHNKEDGIIAMAHNLTNITKNATQHCEIICINELEKSNQNVDFSELILFVTCEPCIMCAYALNLVGINSVYFGCSNLRFGGNGSVLDLNSEKYQSFGGYMNEPCMQILQNFYEEGNLNLEEQFRHRKSKLIKN